MKEARHGQSKKERHSVVRSRRNEYTDPISIDSPIYPTLSKKRREHSLERKKRHKSERRTASEDPRHERRAASEDSRHERRAGRSHEHIEQQHRSDTETNNLSVVNEICSSVSDDAGEIVHESLEALN